MSIAELIMTGTERASKSTDWVADSLAKIGDNVTKVLVDRQQQKQAQEMLPMFQQSMQDAMINANEGDSGLAFSKLMPFLTNPATLKNPYILPALDAGTKMIELAANDYARNIQVEAYRDRYSGGGGGDDRSIFTPRERAAAALGTSNPNAPTPTMTDSSDVYFVDGQQDQPSENIDFVNPLGEGPVGPEGQMPTKNQPAQAPAPSMEQQSQAVKAIAQTAQTPQFKKALLNSANNPPSKEQELSFAEFAKQYNSMPEPEQNAFRQELSVVFPSDKKFNEVKPQLGKNFYPLTKEQRDAVGDNISGLILTPVEEVKSFTAGAKSDSMTFGTNKDDIDKYQQQFIAASTELSQGKLGKFLKQNGGAFNMTYTETPSEVIPTMGTPSGKTTIPSKAILYQKNRDPNEETTPVIELTDGQLAALKIIQTSPSKIRQLRAGDSDSSFVRIAPTGPTREGAKMIPQAATANTSFKTIEEAEASGLPKGTMITINGRKARID
jgi:hypothetical protein